MNDQKTSSKIPYRQGDVPMLTAVEEVPAGFVVAPVDEIVLAKGEVTGHAHRIVGSGAKLLVRETDLEALLDPADVVDLETRFLMVEEEVQLVHEEHGAITIEPGIYELPGQREFTPFGGALVGD